MHVFTHSMYQINWNKLISMPMTRRTKIASLKTEREKVQWLVKLTCCRKTRRPPLLGLKSMRDLKMQKGRLGIVMTILTEIGTSIMKKILTP
jgi:hypothetical protein